MKQSKFLSLNWRDLLHLFLVGALYFVIDFIEKTVLPATNLPDEVKLAIAYGLKKLFSSPTVDDQSKIDKFAEEIGIPKPRP